MDENQSSSQPPATAIINRVQQAKRAKERSWKTQIANEHDVPERAIDDLLSIHKHAQDGDPLATTMLTCIDELTITTASAHRLVKEGRFDPSLRNLTMRQIRDAYTATENREVSENGIDGLPGPDLGRAAKLVNAADAGDQQAARIVEHIDNGTVPLRGGHLAWIYGIGGYAKTNKRPTSGARGRVPMERLIDQLYPLEGRAEGFGYLVEDANTADSNAEEVALVAERLKEVGRSITEMSTKLTEKEPNR